MPASRADVNNVRRRAVIPGGARTLAVVIRARRIARNVAVGVLALALGVTGCSAVYNAATSPGDWEYGSATCVLLSGPVLSTTHAGRTVCQYPGAKKAGYLCAPRYFPGHLWRP